MKKMSFYCLIFFLFLSLSACSIKQSNNAEYEESVSPKLISDVYLDLSKDAGWWIVPQGETELTIHVEAIDTDTILCWFVPTGTETWSERELIGYDIDASDGWSVNWDFGNYRPHNRILIQAIGTDGVTLDREYILVSSEISN